MKKALYGLALAALPAVFLVCSADNPTMPPSLQPQIAPVSSNLPSITTSATRFDLAADGLDAVVIQATAKDANGNALSGSQILWTLTTRGYSGGTGQLSGQTSVTGPGGSASVGYRSPALDFVPVGASVTVRGTLSVPGNPEGSPTSSVTFILRPKGNSPTSSTDPLTGTPNAPEITTVTPSQIKVDANPAVTVIVQGTGFADTSQLLLVTDQRLITISPTFFSAEQLRFSPPSGLMQGGATLFVTAPGDLLSEGFAVNLVTGVSTTGPTPTSPTITQILPTQIPVQARTRMVILGDGFNVTTCPSAGNITFINEFIGLQKLCPVEAATSQRIVIDSPVFGSTQAGTVSVFVQNDDGTTSDTVQVTVLPDNTNAPVITGLSPSSGPTTGETRVLITGQNFAANHSVVIAGPNVFSPPGDICSDNQPVCSNNQCVLDESRGNCTIGGTANFDVFQFSGSGQINIVMPAVGTSAAGPVDVVIRTPQGQPSNIFTYNYTAPAGLLPPVVNPKTVNFTCKSETGCTFANYDILVDGQNFRKCSSLVFDSVGTIWELLPTPDVADCGVPRGSTAESSPRQRLQRLLPLDGMTIRCTERPDLVPLRCLGALDANLKCAGRLYSHDRICANTTSNPFSGLQARMISSPGEADDITSGGAYTWINEAQIRLFDGPPIFVPCETSNIGFTLRVQNDPGRGLSGDFISADGVTVTFTNTASCPTPIPPPSITAITPAAAGTCAGGGGTKTILGTGFGSVSNVLFGSRPATFTQSATTITVASPPAASAADCPSYTCPTGSLCPPAGTVRFTCPVTVSVVTPFGVATTTYTYDSSAAGACAP